MANFLQDLRYGIRRLLKQPVITIVAIISLGLGIGANTSIFSVVNAVLLRPLPYHDSERLVVVWETNSQAIAALMNLQNHNLVAPANFLDLTKRRRVFWSRVNRRRALAICRSQTSARSVPIISRCSTSRY